ncbi:outer membrane beta-barrel protein [Mucilaginibacter aquatilis]|uniref:Outer membrane protein beta-barrel domain-containing protein n=1 Tax=Mucilaginibacter aquatilis TaxID=1517760 RepID=A0A6I4I885_9SPHI|nr:outer membrane beta-barrel protein [Mucilaginibacter aquatilis]MVN89636.1 hypothetical protein [Mucilaginibacter aquatilis]
MKPLQLIITTIALLCTVAAKAQTPVQLIGRYNLGVGIQYNNLYYGEDIIPYSPGGGMGIEAGIRVMPSAHLEPYATIGFQQNIAIRMTDGDDYWDNESYFTFNRTTFNAGLVYKFPLFNTTDKIVRIGGGVNFSIPGRAAFKEDNQKLPSISYKMARGFNLEASYVAYADRRVTVEPGLRYRQIKFNPAGNRMVPDNMNPAQASGFDLSVIIGLNL